MGLYLDEWEIGKTLRTRGRTVGEGDITTFAGLIGDWTPIHVDAKFAQTTVFGERIAHGPLTLSIAIGLMAQMNLFDGTVIGLLNMSWSFQQPVKIGDTIYAEVTATEKRPVSKPGRGIVKLDINAVNQSGVTVCRGVHDVMVLSRPDVAI
ncbi:MAG: MaoC/PaaZ C-terminal domain-containing protein [Gallionella sp.]|nr:MaoC/PaaZ C-terminal domain-containing protein [Gallionella sp.]